MHAHLILSQQPFFLCNYHVHKRVQAYSDINVKTGKLNNYHVRFPERKDASIQYYPAFMGGNHAGGEQESRESMTYDFHQRLHHKNISVPIVIQTCDLPAYKEYFVDIQPNVWTTIIADIDNIHVVSSLQFIVCHWD